MERSHQGLATFRRRKVATLTGAGIVLGFFTLALVFCRRFFDLGDLNSHRIMEGDPALNAWALDWVTYAIKTNPLAILNGNTFFPYPKSILLSEHMLSLALINVLLSPFAASPWFGYNLLIFLSYFASAIGGFLLVREWTGSVRAGIWAGVFWGFLFFRVHHLSHLQILSFEWMPFCALFLLRTARNPSLKNWTAFTFFFALLRKRHVDLICLHPAVPAERRQSIVNRFRELRLGDVLLSDDARNVILRLN